MKIKDKDGNEMTVKEAMAKWKLGMQSVTPLQQSQIAMFGFAIELIGISMGIYYAVFELEQLWLGLILGGALIVTGIGAFGNWQRINVYKKIEEMSKAQIADPVKEVEGGYIG